MPVRFFQPEQNINMEQKTQNTRPGEATASLLQNLTDAGCDAGTKETYLQFHREGKTKERLKLLSRQRKQLLTTIHENQKRLDCLDYLIHTIEDTEATTPKTKGKI